MSMKDTFIKECLLLLKRSDVKTEIKNILWPTIDNIIKELYPYIFISMIFVIVGFLLILGIFILLLRNKKTS